MRTSVVILFIGSLTLLALSHNQVSAGTAKDRGYQINQIEPILSNVYYLQDYCYAYEEDQSLEEKYRHRRSSKYDDDDHDHDHDHDHHHDRHYDRDYRLIKNFEDMAKDIQKKVKYYSEKSYKKVKKHIQRGLERSKKWKQIYLDPVQQPSIVLRLWRPHDESTHAKYHRILEKASPKTRIRCNILLRMMGDVNQQSTALASSFANATIGAMVNFLKVNDKPYLNNYRLRIVSSDPKMTQYWLKGRRLITPDFANLTVSETKTTTKTEAQVPVAVDLVTDPMMYPKPLQPDELQQLNTTDSEKWLLIELETLNKLLNSPKNETDVKNSENLNTEPVSNDMNTQKTNNKEETTNNEDTTTNEEIMKDPHTDDDTELVINLYTVSVQNETTITVEKSPTTETLNKSDNNNKNASANENTSENKNDLNSNNTSSSMGTEPSGIAHCPVGTFDCEGDASRCIPNSLRCNGEDNCGNNYDELLNCGTTNLYYIFGADPNYPLDFSSYNDSPYPSYIDLSTHGFWFATRILVLLLLISLLMYSCSLLCRSCCGVGSRQRKVLISGKSPMIYVSRGKGRARDYEPLLESGSSSSSEGGSRGGLGGKLGRSWKSAFQFGSGPPMPPQHPAGPPPSYFGNQSDNQRSQVTEYIYVNNNYGQPQGSTTVHTNVQPRRDHTNGNGNNHNENNSDFNPSAPQNQTDSFPPLYPNIDGIHRNYGGTQNN